MEKHEIIVPKGIRFVGEMDPETKKKKWEEYDIWNYDFPHILNKELTGCGYTEYDNRKNTPQKLIIRFKVGNTRGL